MLNPPMNLGSLIPKRTFGFGADIYTSTPGSSAVGLVLIICWCDETGPHWKTTYDICLQLNHLQQQRIPSIKFFAKHLESRKHWE